MSHDATCFAPYRDPTTGHVMLAEVTRTGRSWTTTTGLIATAGTVRATRADAWKLADRKYPGAAQLRAAND